MTAAQFKLRYRLDFEGFNELLGIIRPDLEPLDLAQAKRAKWGHDVQTEAKLAMALRYLAGASPLDLELIYMVSKSYVYDCVWKVVDAVNKHLKVEFPIDDVCTDALSPLGDEADSIFHACHHFPWVRACIR